jgi:hypothetical protein
MQVQSIHERSLEESTALSGYYVQGMIPPLAVITVLNNASVSFVLVGLHGISGWMNEPRATEDVDVVIGAKHHKKALKALLASYPNLEVSDLDVVTRLRDPVTLKVVVDLMKPNQQLYRAIFKNAHTVHVSGQTYRIPSLEMAIAMKFSSMISLSRRDEDKYQDAHDFLLMVKTNPKYDAKKLKDLGELVYPGGGDEVLEQARKALAGEKLNL